MAKPEHEFSGTDVRAIMAAAEGIAVIATAIIEDAAYGAGWDGDSTHAPSQNAVYDIVATILTELDLRCLESVFGTSISTGLLLDATALKASAVLQKYHAIDPSADVQSLLGCADEAAIRTLLDLEPGTDFYTKSAEETWRNSVSQTEMGYVDGVTSDIQTQFTARSNKTTAAWSKSVGTSGDYADWATMIAAMADLIAHAVTITLKKGTTLTEICGLKNKHGLNENAFITIKSQKYYPLYGAIPTADGATATTLNDADVFDTDDEYTDCWVLIADGTGTDNGFVPITGTTGDGTNTITVDSWPGTRPDNTSKYVIVGGLVDCQGTQSGGFEIFDSTVKITLEGIGVVDSNTYGFYVQRCLNITFLVCAAYGCDTSGIFFTSCNLAAYESGALVGNNTDGSATQGGARIATTQYAYITQCGISDNNNQGIYMYYGGFASIGTNYGDGNGDWGTYCKYSAQARISGNECSGTSGNHSDEGTADTAADDQAAAYI